MAPEINIGQLSEERQDAYKDWVRFGLDGGSIQRKGASAGTAAATTEEAIVFDRTYSYVVDNGTKIGGMLTEREITDTDGQTISHIALLQHSVAEVLVKEGIVKPDQIV